MCKCYSVVQIDSLFYIHSRYLICTCKQCFFTGSGKTTFLDLLTGRRKYGNIKVSAFFYIPVQTLTISLGPT